MIFITNNKGEKEWFFEPPFMLDANEKYSDKVELVLRKENNKSFIDVVANKAFLEDPDTVYPVIIDPTMDRWDTWSVMIDTFVSSNFPNTAYTSLANIYTGHNAEYYGTMRSFVKFHLPSLPSDSQIISANFNTYQNREDANNTTIDLFQVTNDWTWGTTWNNQPPTLQNPESTLTNNTLGNGI